MYMLYTCSALSASHPVLWPPGGWLPHCPPASCPPLQTDSAGDSRGSRIPPAPCPPGEEGTHCPLLLLLPLFCRRPRLHLLSQSQTGSFLQWRKHNVHVLMRQPRQLIFLRKSDCLRCAVLLCLVVCLFV